MKKLIFIFLLASCSIYAQEDSDNQGYKSIMLNLSGGSYTQLLESNGNHLTNLVSYSSSLQAGFRTSKFTYVKVGVDAASTVSLYDFSYDTYQFPILFGSNILFGNSNKKSPTKIFAEIGPYYRGVRTSNNSSLSDFSTSSSLGMQINLQLTFDVSDRFYALVALRVNRDFEDSFVTEEESIRIKGSYAMQVGFGLKL
ncbi:MAG: hypothetical protein ACQESK_01540 [Bacteroidota bacterium]